MAAHFLGISICSIFNIAGLRPAEGSVWRTLWSDVRRNCPGFFSIQFLENFGPDDVASSIWKISSLLGCI